MDAKNQAKDWSLYRYYEHAVQWPASTLKFINQEYFRLNRKKPYSLREDFCGTGWTAVEWVKQGPRHTSVAVDLSSEPIEYGKERHLKRLRPGQQKRMRYLLKDVRQAKGKFDVIVALNFSYC